MSARWVVFTDLDATLLEARTYSFEAARPALAELRRRGIPLVPCSSKTAAEILHVQALLGFPDPFVPEDGAAVGAPRGYFDERAAPWEDRGTYALLPLSCGRERILEAFAELKRRTGGAVRGFSDMTPEEVARETNLPLELARLAARREFDEPFRFLADEERHAAGLAAWAASRGLRITRGGRYWHLHGATDKGRAVRLLRELFERKLGPIRTLGLGDSPNDLPLLSAVDVPVAVRKPDGSFDPELAAQVPGLRRADGAGPEGWNRAVLEVLGEERRGPASRDASGPRA
jgi:mannosyl-3-phosphoglycerate phosphatase